MTSRLVYFSEISKLLNNLRIQFQVVTNIKYQTY